MGFPSCNRILWLIVAPIENTLFEYFFIAIFSVKVFQTEITSHGYPNILYTKSPFSISVISFGPFVV